MNAGVGRAEDRQAVFLVLPELVRRQGLDRRQEPPNVLVAILLAEQVRGLRQQVLEPDPILFGARMVPMGGQIDRNARWLLLANEPLQL